MLASEIMTENPRTVRPTDTVGDAIDALQSMDVRHLPVVDDEDELVGMISDRDLGALSAPTTGPDGTGRGDPDVRSRPVADVMSADPVAVELDADVREVIEAMLEERIGAVPVLDGDGAVCGIISYVDVLRASLGAGSA